MIRTLRAIIICLLLPCAALADQPWLLAYPQIAHDDKYVYFTGDQWAAVYASQLGNMLSLPRDSLRIPPFLAPQNLANLGAQIYRCTGSALIGAGVAGGDTTRLLPEPSTEAIRCLSGDTVTINVRDLAERMGPLIAHRERLWFGLSLADTVSRRIVGGVGWFDAHTNQFGRVYSPALVNLRPEWIGAVQDTVFLLMRETPGDPASPTLFLGFSIHGGELAEKRFAGTRIPGDHLLSVRQWGDTLLIATDRAVAVWKYRQKPLVWESRAWAAPGGGWLYLKTFPGGDPAAGDTVRFLPLAPNIPADVKAKIGDWLQVVSPIGIEGYVDPAEWKRHEKIWGGHFWHCGDSVCFARVRVPMKDRLVPVDFCDTELTYIDEDHNGVKIGFRAAWARQADLAPVLMPR